MPLPQPGGYLIFHICLSAFLFDARWNLMKWKFRPASMLVSCVCLLRCLFVQLCHTAHSVLKYRCLHSTAPSYLAETILQFPALLRGIISICWHVDFAGADNSPFDTGWQRVSGGCSKSLEFAALSCQGHAFLARLPPRTQDCTV